jgi:winged helix domain-containing protein/ATPase family protein associated with various cellular activities (AAA)
MTAGLDVRSYASNYQHLEDELRWIDLLIRLRAKGVALQNASEAQGARAIYITAAEVEWLLDQLELPKNDDAAAGMLRNQLATLREEIDARTARSLEAGVFLAVPQLCNLFGLSAFEREAVVICLAPELRRRYDRLYAYLQDDITRKRPSVDLVLELLCDTEVERWGARGLLSDSASLLRAGLLRKVTDPNSPSGSSGLAQLLELDPRICQFLLGGGQIDARLAGQAQIYRPNRDADPAPVDSAIITGVENLVERYLAQENADKRKLVLHLHGPRGVGKRELALELCRRFNGCLLNIDVELLLAKGPEGESLLRAAFREALLQQAFLHLEHADALLQETARSLLKALQVAVSEYGWLVFLSGEAPWTKRHEFSGCIFHSVALSIPDVSVRAAVWERSLSGKTPEAASWASQLAGQFRLTPGQIRSAIELASNRVLMRKEKRELTRADLPAACREQSNHRLRDLAVKIEPHYGWNDLVLPAEKLAHLREICGQFRHRYKVFGTWGFGKKLSYGKGLSALFIGPSGTGKTMAAEVLARELELHLYKVDLSGLVSKYIGETEKNLSRIFEEAETSNAILFFDEADALFGKRTKVRDAHDRYANIETSFLLQKMEEYEGVVILATNLSENMDEAFTRRIRFIVEFPFPDEANRLRIWKAHLPAETPVSADVDCAGLAREFTLSGGNIRNIALSAAFLAADDGDEVGLQHILHGTRREFEKLGRQWRDYRVQTREGR